MYVKELGQYLCSVSAEIGLVTSCLGHIEILYFILWNFIYFNVPDLRNRSNEVRFCKFFEMWIEGIRWFTLVVLHDHFVKKLKITVFLTSGDLEVTWTSIVFMADPIGHVCEGIKSISLLSYSHLTEFFKITRAETMT